MHIAKLAGAVICGVALTIGVAGNASADRWTNIWPQPNAKGKCESVKAQKEQDNPGFGYYCKPHDRYPSGNGDWVLWEYNKM